MEIEMPAPTADQWFQIAIFLASACAAVFWMSSANGSTVRWPWHTSEKVPLEEFAAHQAKWNSRAAVATGLTAALQGIQILYHSPLFHM
jgi:hypothetical protein